MSLSTFNDTLREHSEMYHRAAESYLEQADNALGAHAVARETAETMRLYDRRIKQAEAEMIVNGEIAGKNEAERAAAKLLAMANSPAIQKAISLKETAESQREQAMLDAADAANRMAAAKYDMRYAIATIEYLTAALSGEPKEETR